MRYQVRATVATAISLDFDLDFDTVVLEEARTAPAAIQQARDVFDKFHRAHGHHVYNYASIEAYDTKNDEVLDTFEFDTYYVSRTGADHFVSQWLDECFGTVSIAGVEMPTSYAIYATDRRRYQTLQNIYLLENNMVVVD